MKPIGHAIIRLDQVPSTNSLVMATEEYLENHGLVLTANHQTAGKGRRGRGWISVPGVQLQFSAVIHPSLSPEEVPLISLAAGLAVAEALEETLGLHATLKWPNDVLVHGRKLSGILVELAHSPAGRPRVVVGIGLNCNGSPADYPPELEPNLTTAAWEAGHPVDGEGLLQAILADLQRQLERLEAGESLSVLEDWSERAHLEGRQLRFPTPSGMREGRVLELTSRGALLIETFDGHYHTHLSGEVEWLD